MLSKNGKSREGAPGTIIAPTPNMQQEHQPRSGMSPKGQILGKGKGKAAAKGKGKGKEQSGKGNGKKGKAKGKGKDGKNKGY